MKESLILCPYMETQPAAVLPWIISISHLDLFKVEGHFAVFAVERSCLTFSLIMSVLLCTKDQGLTGLALYPLIFTATFMLSLKMEGRSIIITAFLWFVLLTQARCVYSLSFSILSKNDRCISWCSR